MDLVGYHPRLHLGTWFLIKASEINFSTHKHSLEPLATPTFWGNSVITIGISHGNT